MSQATFIPAVWSAELLVALRKSLVYGNLVNRNYEGEIAAMGDTVHINSVSDPTIVSYTRGATLTYEQLNTTDQALVIDQAKAFSFEVDDIDKRQAAGNVMGVAISRAAYKLADLTDQFIAAKAADADAGNIIASNVVSTVDQAYGVFTALKQKLTEANVPETGRSVVIPPWLLTILETDVRFTSAANTGGSSAAITGFVRQIVGFDVYVSNNVPLAGSAATGNWSVIAMDNSAITFANQINQVEALRLQTTFGDAVRGLHLYGAKTVRPTAVAVDLIKKA